MKYLIFIILIVLLLIIMLILLADKAPSDSTRPASGGESTQSTQDALLDSKKDAPKGNTPKQNTSGEVVSGNTPSGGTPNSQYPQLDIEIPGGIPITLVSPEVDGVIKRSNSNRLILGKYVQKDNIRTDDILPGNYSSNTVSILSNNQLEFTRTYINGTRIIWKTSFKISDDKPGVIVIENMPDAKFIQALKGHNGFKSNITDWIKGRFVDGNLELVGRSYEKVLE